TFPPGILFLPLRSARRSLASASKLVGQTDYDKGLDAGRWRWDVLLPRLLLPSASISRRGNRELNALSQVMASPCTAPPTTCIYALLSVKSAALGRARTKISLHLARLASKGEDESP